MGDSWKVTAQLYTGFIQKPKMAQKLLLKPPFKYLFDIITATTQKTGFANGLYVGDELKPDFYGQKDRKITYLNKMISLVSMMDGSKVQADPKKIVAGLQAELTNLMLQAIHRCATSGKSSDSYVKKVLGGGSDEPQVKQQKKKIDRPPSAAKTKKDTKKPIERVEDPKEEQQAPIEPIIEKPKQKQQQYSKKVEELRKEGQQQEQAQKQTQIETEKNKKQLNMGRLGGKKKKNAQQKEKGLINSTGQLTQKQLDLVKSMIQSICQNTAPLGKSIQFINDDIQSMNKELVYWRKQYNSSKAKMQNQLKLTEQALLPIYDKLGQIQEQIKDQKGKIQTAKAQILKNDSTIRDLLLSVVTTK